LQRLSLSSTSDAKVAFGIECCLLFDDDNSLKLFTAMCHGIWHGY